MSVYAKIAAVQAELAGHGIDKSQTNAHGRYKFRGIDDLYNALAPMLAKHGLVLIPKIVSKEVRQVQTSGGKVTNHWTVDVQYTLADAESESHVETVFPGEAYDTSDKGLNKALTAAYKYLCFELFCIPTESSDDADSEHHQIEAQQLMGDDERHSILSLCMQSNTPVDGFVTWLGYNKLTEVPMSEYARATAALNKKIEKLSMEYATGEAETAHSLEAGNGR